MFKTFSEPVLLSKILKNLIQNYPVSILLEFLSLLLDRLTKSRCKLLVTLALNISYLWCGDKTASYRRFSIKHL